MANSDFAIGRLALAELPDAEALVREAGWNQQLLIAFTVQFNGDMPSKGRRGAAKIDGHVENAPTKHADQLGLRKRRALKVQAAHRSRPRRA